MDSDNTMIETTRITLSQLHASSRQSSCCSCNTVFNNVQNILAECVTCYVTMKLTSDLSDMEYTVHSSYHSISLSCCNYHMNC